MRPGEPRAGARATRDPGSSPVDPSTARLGYFALAALIIVAAGIVPVIHITRSVSAVLGDEGNGRRRSFSS